MFFLCSYSYSIFITNNKLNTNTNTNNKRNNNSQRLELQTQRGPIHGSRQLIRVYGFVTAEAEASSLFRPEVVWNTVGNLACFLGNYFCEWVYAFESNTTALATTIVAVGAIVVVVVVSLAIEAKQRTH